MEKENVKFDMGKFEKSEKAIEEFRTSLTHEVLAPQTFAYILLYQAVQALHAMRNYGLCICICEAVTNYLNS